MIRMNDESMLEDLDNTQTPTGLLLSVDRIAQARNRDRTGESDGGSSGVSDLND
ncbi:MAG: hypothetical protein ACRDYA_24585 [Egibacteraceae bacterium]